MGLIHFIKNSRVWFTHQRKLLKEISEPIPDPPGYKSPYDVTWAEHKKILKKGFSLYLQTWATEAEQHRKRKEQMMNDVRVQKEALKMLSKEAREGTETAKTLFEQTMAKHVAVFKVTAKEFTQGYKDGRDGKPQHPEEQSASTEPPPSPEKGPPPSTGNTANCSRE